MSPFCKNSNYAANCRVTSRANSISIKWYRSRPIILFYAQVKNRVVNCLQLPPTCIYNIAEFITRIKEKSSPSVSEWSQYPILTRGKKNLPLDTPGPSQRLHVVETWDSRRSHGETQKIRKIIRRKDWGSSQIVDSLFSWPKFSRCAMDRTH